MKKSVLAALMLSLISLGASAQKLRTYTSNDADSMACVTNLSLYIEFFKQGNYADAVKGWREAVKICPKSTESLWINGGKMYTDFIEKEKDAVKKDKLIDSLMWIYDQRIVHFGNEGYVLGRKGVDMYRFKSNDPKATYDVLAKAYDLQKNELEPASTQYLFKSAYDLYKKNQFAEADLFDLYSKCAEISDFNQNGKMKDMYAKIQENIDSWFGNVADCDKLIQIFSPKFKAAPTDAKLIAQITKLLDKQNCGDREFYLEVAVAGYALNPSAQSAYDIGKGYYSKDKYNDALKFFKEAAQSEDKELSYNANKLAANSCLAIGAASSAKSYALKMIELQPNSGEAYLIIGKAYAAGRSDCGTDECKNRAAYWAAVDKFQKAKAIDSSVADQAQQLINSYTAQFPKTADCFFYGLNDGDSFTLDCWIGETTTVRTRAN